MTRIAYLPEELRLIGHRHSGMPDVGTVQRIRRSYTRLPPVLVLPDSHAHDAGETDEPDRRLPGKARA
jgi:hypothetical protein